MLLAADPGPANAEQDEEPALVLRSVKLADKRRTRGRDAVASVRR